MVGQRVDRDKLRLPIRRVGWRIAILKQHYSYGRTQDASRGQENRETGATRGLRKS